MSTRLCLILLVSMGFCCSSLAFHFLSGYETLNYNTINVENSHRRAKRHLASSDPHLSIVYLNFTAHRRRFRLKLWPDQSAFASDHQLFINNKPIANQDASFLYHGIDTNDPDSYVFGSLIDGVFDGHILSPESEYHVEKISRYSGHDNGQHSVKKLPVHSFIYKNSQIDYSKLKINCHTSDGSLHQAGGCGLHGSVKNWMKHLQKSSEYSSSTNTVKYLKPTLAQESVQPWLKYTKHTQSNDSYHHSRHKRASSSHEKDIKTGLYAVRTCTLYMQADPKLWEYVVNHEGQRNAERTRDEMFALFNNHVKAVNQIYESTDFNGVRGITFSVKRTTIWDNTSCPNSDLDDSKKNPFCEENVDVSNYLNLNSLKNQSDFCLAYALTYRDFVGGTLGLAWVASAAPDGSSFSASSGGICEMYKLYSEGGRRVKRSLNTGIITLVNYHNRVPTKVSQLTLAHEIGHNFGSPHDFPPQCQPGGMDGNYIMFASATSGDKPNNAKFSSCSIANISAVLREVLSQPPGVEIPGAKRNCLIDPLTSFCGNGVVEEGEWCDCGFDEAECKERQDSCCYPRNTDSKPNPKGCQKIDGAQCSRTQGPCCTDYCGFIPLTLNMVCRQASDCSQASQCDGRQAECPASLPRPDNTLCQENTKICHSGSCNRSICELIGMSECFITTGTPQEQCQLSCRNKQDAEAPCLPSTRILALKSYYSNRSTKGQPIGILLRPGSPCNDYKGYCDIFQKCRSVDSNGPLSRLKNLLFNKQTLKTVGDWIQLYWWAVVLMALCTICLMALFIKCCAVHTPSTNPRKPPAQSFYETLRHPSTLLRYPNRNNSHGDHNNHNRHHHHHHRHHYESNGQDTGHNQHRHHNHPRHHHNHRQPTGNENSSASTGDGRRHHRSSSTSNDNRRCRRTSRDATVSANIPSRMSAAVVNNGPTMLLPPPQRPPPPTPLISPVQLTAPLMMPSPLVINIEPPPPYTERPPTMITTTTAPAVVASSSSAITTTTTAAGDFNRATSTGIVNVALMTQQPFKNNDPAPPPHGHRKRRRAEQLGVRSRHK